MDSRQANPAAGRDSVASPAKTHRGALPVGQVATTGSTPAEQWFFRIDGREYGPTSRDQLERFLAPPRLCKSLEVMCSNREGLWFLIAKHETVEMVLERFGIVTEVIPEAAPSESKPSMALRASAAETEAPPEFARPKPVYKSPNPVVEWFSETFEALSEVVWKYRTAILLVLGVVGVNVAMLYLFVDVDARNRVILTRYESMWNTASKMEAEQSSEEAWQTFSDESQKELDVFIKELTPSASVHNVTQQQLLFVGRDILKPLFAATEPPPKNSPLKRVIQRYFKLLNERVPRDLKAS